MLEYEEFGEKYEIIEYDPYADDFYAGSLVFKVKVKKNSKDFEKSIKGITNDIASGFAKIPPQNFTKEGERLLQFMIAKTFDKEWYGEEAANFIKSV